MLDNRIYTFLKLCDLMNYRATAEALNMTQPAVTQHIKYLEREYGCRLFYYNGKKIYKTEAAHMLEQYGRSAAYNEINIRQKLESPEKSKVRIGVTKTIGSYVIGDRIVDIMKRKDMELYLVVDNTENLLHMLNQRDIDLALIEGFFDKDDYGYSLMKTENFVGICAKNHEFAGKEVAFEDIFKETLILREEGSGTRSIFEEVLKEHNYSVSGFDGTACINSFILIKKLVLADCGISFVYEAVADSDSDLATFTIKGVEVKREFSFVFLKDTEAKALMELFR